MVSDSSNTLSASTYIYLLKRMHGINSDSVVLAILIWNARNLSWNICYYTSKLFMKRSQYLSFKLWKLCTLFCENWRLGKWQNISDPTFVQSKNLGKLLFRKPEKQVIIRVKKPGRKRLSNLPASLKERLIHCVILNRSLLLCGSL